MSAEKNKLSGQWYHVTTIEQAHVILTQGMIAPVDKADHDPAQYRNRTWGDDHPLRSRNGYVYLAREDIKPVKEIMRIINEERKAGTNELIALRVNIEKIDPARFAADEDVLDNPQNFVSYWREFADWLNKTKGAKIPLDLKTSEQYEAAAYDFMDQLIEDGSLEEHNDIWEEYNMYDGFSEEMIDIQQKIAVAIEDGSTADKVDREIDVHEHRFVEMSIDQGLIAIQGNIHPDDISLHPDYEIKYKLWTRDQDIEIEPLPYAHINPDQLQLPGTDGLSL